MADNQRELDAFLEAEAARVPVITGQNVRVSASPRSLGPIQPGGPTGMYAEEQPFEPDTTEAELYARALQGDKIAEARLKTMLGAYEEQSKLAEALTPFGYLAASVAPVTGTALSMKNLPAAGMLDQLAQLDPEAGVLEKAGAKGNALLEALGAIPGGNIPKIMGGILMGKGIETAKNLGKLQPRHLQGLNKFYSKYLKWQNEEDVYGRAGRKKIIPDIEQFHKDYGVFTYPGNLRNPRIEFASNTKLKFKDLADLENMIKNNKLGRDLTLEDVLDTNAFTYYPELRKAKIQVIDDPTEGASAYFKSSYPHLNLLSPSFPTPDTSVLAINKYHQDPSGLFKYIVEGKEHKLSLKDIIEHELTHGQQNFSGLMMTDIDMNKGEMLDLRRDWKQFNFDKKLLDWAKSPGLLHDPTSYNIIIGQLRRQMTKLSKAYEKRGGLDIRAFDENPHYYQGVEAEPDTQAIIREKMTPAERRAKAPIEFLFSKGVNTIWPSWQHYNPVITSRIEPLEDTLFTYMKNQKRTNELDNLLSNMAQFYNTQLPPGW